MKTLSKSTNVNLFSIEWSALNCDCAIRIDTNDESASKSTNVDLFRAQNCNGAIRMDTNDGKRSAGSGIQFTRLVA
jgi:hypothetical protein